MDTSIVVVNWNTRDMLQECLESIMVGNRELSYEIVVVDNASTDGSPDMVRREFRDVALIENRYNRGFAAANNQGIEIASGRYILLLNSDTIILDDAIGKTLEFADNNPEYGVVGCQVWEDDTTIQETCFSFHTPWNVFCNVTGLARIFPNSRLLGGDKMHYWDRKSDREVDVVSGMFILVRREAIEQVGLLDERFFIYCEEADWCYRMRQAGWKNYFWTGARIIHRDGGGKSTGQVNVKMEVQKIKSLLLFIRKHYGVTAEWSVRVVIALSSVVKLAALGVVWPIRGSRVTGKLAKFLCIVRYCVSNVA